MKLSHMVTHRHDDSAVDSDNGNTVWIGNTNFTMNQINVRSYCL